jgi:hypothetical protein
VALSILPEFESRGLRSLLWELKSVVPAEKRMEIARALNAAQELAKLRMNAAEIVGTNEARTMPVPSELRNRVHKILDEMRLERWRIP